MHNLAQIFAAVDAADRFFIMEGEADVVKALQRIPPEMSRQRAERFIRNGVIPETECEAFLQLVGEMFERNDLLEHENQQLMQINDEMSIALDNMPSRTATEVES